MIPLFFIYKEKSALTKSKPAFLSTDTQTNQAQENLRLDISIAHMPAYFQAVLMDIDEQCHLLRHKELNKQQWFTLKKLIHTRIPELLTNYLNLDKDYVKTAIVDKDNQQTTQDIVYAQLKSILHFIKNVSQQNDSSHVDKILASRNYLEDIYLENGIKPDLVQQKIQPTVDTLLSDKHQDEYMSSGHQYLNECYQGQPHLLSQSLIYELGKLVFISDNTVLLVNQKFTHVRLEAFDQIICDSIPVMINQFNGLTSERKIRLKQGLVIEQIRKINALLNDALNVLAKQCNEDEKVNALSHINTQAKEFIAGI